MEGFLIVLLVVVLIAVGAYFSWYLKKKRREELALFARQMGLEFYLVDFIGLLSLPFDLLRRGDGRGAENLMTGTWHGIALTEFDYWYYDESTDSKGNRQRTYHYFSCVTASYDAYGAHLIVTPENLFTRLADGVGLHDIQFETEAFNKAFQVKCADRKFANDFIDQRMMAWLQSEAWGWSFETSANQLLVYTKRRKPMELVPVLGALEGLRQHIPRVVAELYGGGGPR